MSDFNVYTSKLANKRILIFGGTGGIGRAVASLLLEAGASAILSSSRQSSLDSTITTLLSQYPSARSRLSGVPLNLQSPFIDADFSTLTSSGAKKLDHIIYLAGERIPTIPLSDLNLERVAQIHHTRSFVPILLAKHSRHALHSTPNSSIIFNTGSVAEKPIPGGWATLAFIGAGTCGLARQLALDLSPIRVNAVAMGVTDTDLWADMPKEARNGFMKKQAETVLTGRVGRAEDVAEAFGYLCKDGNVTGHVVHTSGGDLLV